MAEGQSPTSSRQDRIRTKVKRITEKKTHTLLTQQRQQTPFCLQKINPLLPTNPLTTQTINQTTTLYIKTNTPANSQPAPQIPQINPSPKPQLQEPKLNHIHNTTNCTSRQTNCFPINLLHQSQNPNPQTHDPRKRGFKHLPHRYQKSLIYKVHDRNVNSMVCKESED